MVSCGFLFDSLRRLTKTKVENKTISTGAVAIFVLAFVIEMFGCISFVLPFYIKDFSLYLITIGYSMGILLLTTIIFLIGISSVQTEKEV